jgi:hypothetical protein
MSKWFDSKEDLIDALQSIAYQLDSRASIRSSLLSNHLLILLTPIF